METKELKFLITNNDSQIEIRWDVALGKPGSNSYRVLQEELEVIDGVERVRMRRYSCLLDVAVRVRQIAPVSEDVTQALAAPAGAIHHALLLELPTYEIRVTNAGFTLKLYRT